MTNQQAAINPHEEERERKNLIELIKREGDQLAKIIVKMEISQPRRVVFIPKEENGNVGSFELRFEHSPLVQKVIDQHTKRWQDLIDEHNKKFGLESIKM